MHTPPLARIIVERAMLGAAVVPDRQRTNLPAESAGKLRLHGMSHQKIENRPRLGAPEPFERLRVIAYVERFAAGLRMGAHKRMRGFRLHVAGVAHLGCHLLVAGVTAIFGRTYLVVPAEYLAVSDIAGLDDAASLEIAPLLPAARQPYLCPHRFEIAGISEFVPVAPDHFFRIVALHAGKCPRQNADLAARAGGSDDQFVARQPFDRPRHLRRRS